MIFSQMLNAGAGLFYRYLVRPILFRFDSEKVHVWMTNLGAFLGEIPFAPGLVKKIFVVSDPSLTQNYFGLHFESPVGMAAGFDYEAKLPDITSSLGFGFQTVGTITNGAYGGNPPPLLGRLPKSLSLLVNKGFKNSGILAVQKKLAGRKFVMPIGLSIGKTNGKKEMTQIEAIQDILEVFQAAEKGIVLWSYYELNISCPNLFGSVEFYSPNNLRDLLAAVTGLKLKRPLFIKMPIDKSDEGTVEMLKVIQYFPVQGVIFGNLQKNRQDPALDQAEIAKYARGYFSGRPTQKRSDELIKLSYREVGKMLIIIGCGGIFSAEDAYRKIRNGASLVQLITGLIYKGPQLPAQINIGLARLIRRDGFKHISEAVGVDVR